MGRLCKGRAAEQNEGRGEIKPFSCFHWPVLLYGPYFKGAPICPRRPESRESIRRRCAAPLHRNRTSPPSLWPGRELRKYHYSRFLSSPPPVAIRILSHGLNRSSLWSLGAPVKMAREIGNVPGDWIFSFQGTTNHDGLEKTEIPFPSGEICPLTRQRTFF